MTDPITKAATLPETSSTDSTLIAMIIAAEVARLQADPMTSDIVDAVTARLPILLRAISAALEVETHPESIAQRAASIRAARAVATEKGHAMARAIAARQDAREAAAMIAKCQDGFDRATTELARLEKRGAPDREKVLAEGAVALWIDRLGKAERNVAALEKR